VKSFGKDNNLINFIVKNRTKMNPVLLMERNVWYDFLTSLLNEIDVFVPVNKGQYIDYVKYTGDGRNIVYNRSLPVTPLKYFVLPFKENVVISKKIHNKKLIIGVPACDLAALSLLDRIYLDDRFTDNNYRENRENMIIVGTDCYQPAANCHCTTYGLKPYPESNADMILSDLDSNIVLKAVSDKGLALVGRIKAGFKSTLVTQGTLDQIDRQRESVINTLREKNRDLPSYGETGPMIAGSEDEIWERYSSSCVSCGACATICPTCTCFLLIDRPGFEKVRQTDACQYPGFGKIAAGEDPLRHKDVRFRNRYMCKFLWKPENFGHNACTGCGRCIDCCPGNINKNEIFMEMIKAVVN